MDQSPEPVSYIRGGMNLSPFMRDIDELIDEFVEGNEIDLQSLNKMSIEYAEANRDVIKGVGDTMEMEVIKQLQVYKRCSYALALYSGSKCRANPHCMLIVTPRGGHLEF